MAVTTEPHRAAVGVGGGGVGGGVGRGGRVRLFIDRAAAGVAADRGVGVVEFEVGARGIEKQQVNLKIKNCGDLPIHLLGQLVFDPNQPVHGPVTSVLVDLW